MCSNPSCRRETAPSAPSAPIGTLFHAYGNCSACETLSVEWKTEGELTAAQACPQQCGGIIEWVATREVLV